MKIQKHAMWVLAPLLFLIFSPGVGSAAEEVACSNLAATVQANIANFELGPGLVTMTSIIPTTGQGANQYCRVSLKQGHAINIEVGYGAGSYWLAFDLWGVRQHIPADGIPPGGADG